MSALEELQVHIPGYADYANMDARHQVDKQIRAWLGEALAAAREKVQVDESLRDRLEGLILRCEFSDQRVVHAADHAKFDGHLVDRVHELDLGIVKVADHIREATTGAELSPELDEAARLLDERFGAISEAEESK